MGKNETEGDGDSGVGGGSPQDTQDTIPCLVAEGEEHIDYEDSPEVVIDPKLRTWLFDFCALLAQHARVSEHAAPG